MTSQVQSLLKCEDLIGTRQELVSVKMVENKGKIYFNWVDNLKPQEKFYVRIRTIETFANATVPLDPEGYTVATETCIRHSFLHLVLDGTELNAGEPLIRYATQFNQGKIQPVNYNDVDWTKTYIQINDSSLLTENGVYLISITYDLIPKN